MTSSKGEISRRRFLNDATQAGVALSSAGTLTSLSGCGGSGLATDKAFRYIDASECVGCRMCVPLCPMGAIGMADAKAQIDPDECAECGVCWRSRVCPADAIRPVELGWPRVLRATYSNPLAEHPTTGVPGRGTEGIKTNDSKERYAQGSMGVFIELGRPVLGARFRDVERVVKTFRARGYEVIPENPVAELIADPQTGALDPEVLDEKVISCLVEFVLPDSAGDEVMEMVHALAGEVESVFNVSLALRANDEGLPRLDDVLGTEVFRLPNGKVNLGAARDVVAERA